MRKKKEREHLEGQDVDVKIILKLILKVGWVNSD